MKYKWYVKFIYKSGAIQYGYLEDENKNSQDVLNKFMMAGATINNGTFTTLFTDEHKSASLCVRLLEIASMTLSGNPIDQHQNSIL